MKPVEREVAAKLGVVVDPKAPQARPELPAEGAVAADDQSPAGGPPAQASEHLGEKERVLLGVQATYGDHGEIAVVAASCGGLDIDELVLAHERDQRSQQAPRVAVARCEV